MSLYRIYGLTLATELSLTARLGPGRPPVDLDVELVRSRPPIGGWEGTEPVFTSPRKTPDGEAAALLFRVGEWEVLRFSGLYDFFLSDRRIVVWPVDGGVRPGGDIGLETRLLGPVLAYWLERRRILAFHASAVATERGALLFLSDNGGGKSSLAAECLAAGHALLSDDLVAVERRGGRALARAAYPEMRLWPADARHFVGDTAGLPRVDPDSEKRRIEIGPGGFGRFEPAAQPVAALVLPDVGGSAGQVLEPLPAARATMELVRHSYSPYIVEGAGLQPGRLRQIAGLATAIPGWRLSHPAGPEARRAALATLLAELDLRP